MTSILFVIVELRCHVHKHVDFCQTFWLLNVWSFRMNDISLITIESLQCRHWISCNALKLILLLLLLLLLLCGRARKFLYSNNLVWKVDPITQILTCVQLIVCNGTCAVIFRCVYIKRTVNVWSTAWTMQTTCEQHQVEIVAILVLIKYTNKLLGDYLLYNIQIAMRICILQRF